MSVITRLKETALRVWLFFYGVRFYHRDIPPNTLKVREAEFRVTDGSVVKFNFYKEKLEDIVLKRGEIHKETSVGFIIQSEIDDTFPESIRKFDRMCFFFNGRINKLGFNDIETTDLLLEIYIDFLVASIRKSTSEKAAKK